jgi:hypothetical protein
LQDIEMLNVRQFNHIYQEHYKNKRSFEGTLRRVKQYLVLTEIHKPSKNIYHWVLPKRELKNAWKLRGGQKNVSYQQVLLRVEYLKKSEIRVEHLWITFSSGVNRVLSLRELYRQAKDEMDYWLLKVKSLYKTYVKILDIIVKVNRFLR